RGQIWRVALPVVACETGSYRARGRRSRLLHDPAHGVDDGLRLRDVNVMVFRTGDDVFRTTGHRGEFLLQFHPRLLELSLASIGRRRNETMGYDHQRHVG